LNIPDAFTAIPTFSSGLSTIHSPILLKYSEGAADFLAIEFKTLTTATRVFGVADSQFAFESEAESSKNVV
jgi:hypothetical protein